MLKRPCDQCRSTDRDPAATRTCRKGHYLCYRCHHGHTICPLCTAKLERQALGLFGLGPGMSLSLHAGEGI